MIVESDCKVAAGVDSRECLARPYRRPKTGMYISTRVHFRTCRNTESNQTKTRVAGLLYRSSRVGDYFSALSLNAASS